MAEYELTEAEHAELVELANWEIPTQVEVTDAQVAHINVAGHVELPKRLISNVASCAQLSHIARKNWLALSAELKPYFPGGRQAFASEKPRFVKICLLGYSPEDRKIFNTTFPKPRREWSVRRHRTFTVLTHLFFLFMKCVPRGSKKRKRGGRR